MSRAYVGITGLMNREETEALVRSLLPDISRQLMVGVLISNKTLNGGTNKWPGRYPKMDKIGQIFVKHPQVINMIHYHTDDQTALCGQLMDLMVIGGDMCNGIQLNMTRPKPDQLEKFKHVFPDKKIVLQINNKMLKDTPKQLAMQFLVDYDKLVDYVLFDASGGKGEELNVDFLLPYIETFKSISENINLVVAGGLKANNLQSLLSLLRVYPNLSIDAEGCLRDDNDDLSIIKARNYLHEAMAILD